MSGRVSECDIERVSVLNRFSVYVTCVSVYVYMCVCVYVCIYVGFVGSM